MAININAKLLKALKSRGSKSEGFNRGILTADSYVKTMQECVGSNQCYKFAAKGNISFNDVLSKSASTLTYNNKNMGVEDSYDFTKEFNHKDIEGNTLLLPKNTLMVFRNVITTPSEDRDGDILRTQGAQPDPEMLLLWQHVHTLPIGKMIGVVEHSSKTLTAISAIVDMNELSHDAAVMVDNKMGRFSHGFRALDYEERDNGGFDIKSYEIMEESLVSVPSNSDARTEEVLLSLVEGGKMTSSLMKSYGEGIRAKMPVTSAVVYKQTVGDVETVIEASNVADFDTVFKKVNEKGVVVQNTVWVDGEEQTENTNENEPRSGSESSEGKGKCTCASKETDETKAETKDPQDQDVKEMTAKQAMAIFVALSTNAEKQHMVNMLTAFKGIEDQSKHTKEIMSLVGLN